MNLNLLASKWQKLFQSFQGKTALIKTEFSQLVTAYSGRNRLYHNLSHIENVLNFIERVYYLADNEPAIQMAAWFHDVIYDPKSHDNEEKSAEFAATSLISLNVPVTTIERVVYLILSTQKHDASPNDIDNQILQDADLTILGWLEPEYLVYAQSIRQEYSWLSDTEYKLGRTKILQSFLEKDQIYFTYQAFQLFELSARSNIKNELLTLAC